MKSDKEVSTKVYGQQNPKSPNGDAPMFNEPIGQDQISRIRNAITESMLGFSSEVAVTLDQTCIAYRDSRLGWLTFLPNRSEFYDYAPDLIKQFRDSLVSFVGRVETTFTTARLEELSDRDREWLQYYTENMRWRVRLLNAYIEEGEDALQTELMESLDLAA